MKKMLCSFLSLCTLTLQAQPILQPFLPKDVRLLPSRFQQIEG